MLRLWINTIPCIYLKQNSWKPLQYNQSMMEYHKSYKRPLACSPFQRFQLHMIVCLHMLRSLGRLEISAWRRTSKLMEYKVEQEFEQKPKTKVM